MSWFWQGVELAGMAVFTYGAYLAHPAAGFVSGGAALIFIAAMATSGINGSNE